MKHYIGAGNPMRAQFEAKAPYEARHFAWSYEAGRDQLYREVAKLQQQQQQEVHV